MSATRVNVDTRCVHRLLVVATCVSESMRGCDHHSTGTACRLLDTHETTVAHLFATIANRHHRHHVRHRIWREELAGAVIAQLQHHIDLTQDVGKARGMCRRTNLPRLARNLDTQFK